MLKQLNSINALYFTSLVAFQYQVCYLCWANLSFNVLFCAIDLRVNTQRYDIYSILLPVCMVATGLKVTYTRCGTGKFDMIRHLQSFCFNYFILFYFLFILLHE